MDDGFLLLRSDADEEARTTVALSLVEALRPSARWVSVELGGSVPARAALIDRARELGLQPGDHSGVVWEGSTENAEVWAWAKDCLPVSSWWHLFDGSTPESALLAYATDRLGSMCVLASSAPEQPSGWLVAT